MIKTIWNSGDIITSEKWNRINDNLSVLKAYQLPIIIDQDSNPIINKSYNEIYKLLQQGIICYYIFDDVEDMYINYIIGINNTQQTFYTDSRNSLGILNENQMYILPSDEPGVTY